MWRWAINKRWDTRLSVLWSTRWLWADYAIGEPADWSFELRGDVDEVELQMRSQLWLANDLEIVSYVKR